MVVMVSSRYWSSKLMCRPRHLQVETVEYRLVKP